MNLSRENILDFLHCRESTNSPETYSRNVWEMDRNTFHLLRKMHDENHRYDWIPDLENSTQGTFLNIDIVIIKDKGLILKYIYPRDSKIASISYKL